MFAFDHVLADDPRFNLYGTHPRLDQEGWRIDSSFRYTVVEEDGSTHGVVFINSNAQEFETFPLPGLVYRTIGSGLFLSPLPPGGLLDILILVGPSPEQVVQQYTAAVGRCITTV